MDQRIYDKCQNMRCQKRLLKKKYRLNLIAGSQLFQDIIENGGSLTSLICNKCYLKGKPTVNIRVIRDFDGEDTALVRTFTKTAKKCFLCNNERGKNRIKKSEIARVYNELGVLIPHINRSCQNHLEGGIFTEESMQRIALQAEERHCKSRDLFFLVDGLTEIIRTQDPPNCLNFDSEMNEHEIKALTGLTSAQFNELFERIRVRLHNSPNRSKKNALALFLMKLRLGLSQNVLGVMFKMPQCRVSETINTVRLILKEVFVPIFLGYQHISRQEYIERHSTTLANTICQAEPDTAICILDGTYLYIQKSSDQKIQKSTYSMQKGRNLVKPMMVVSASGYILHVDGLYLADGANNDANIFHSMVTDENGFLSFFGEDDVIIVDRGFRDFMNYGNLIGLDMKAPPFLVRGQKQFSAEESNESRLVTKLRWVVESVNGRLKNVFKFFESVIQNTYLNDGHLKDYLDIACALLNCYFPPLKTNEFGDEQMGNMMLRRAKLSNCLKLEIEAYPVFLKPKIGPNWEKLEHDDEELEDFPTLSIDEIRRFTFGVYQVKLAPGYIQNLKRSTGGELKIMKNLDEPSFISVKFPSRHVSDKSHRVWIRYTAGKNEIEGIGSYYCTCKSGSRVVGSCCHVASLIWFLSFARHQAVVPQPGPIGRSLINAATNDLYNYN